MRHYPRGCRRIDELETRLGVIFSVRSKTSQVHTTDSGNEAQNEWSNICADHRGQAAWLKRRYRHCNVVWLGSRTEFAGGADERLNPFFRPLELIVLFVAGAKTMNTILSALQKELESWSNIYRFLRGLDRSNPLFYRDNYSPSRERSKHRRGRAPNLFVPKPLF